MSRKIYRRIRPCSHEFTAIDSRIPNPKMECIECGAVIPKIDEKNYEQIFDKPPLSLLSGRSRNHPP